MQRFAFRLERVLKVKRQQEALAAREVVRARNAAAAAHAHAAALRDRLAAVSRALAERVGQPTAPHQWLTAFEIIEQLSDAIAAADRHALECDTQLAAAVAKRKQAATDVEALDTLRRQRFAEWRKERDAAEQEVSDELSTRRLALARPARTGAA